MTFTVGETVGPYRIASPLGQGGMATVYKAYHASLDRYVAIKVLHPHIIESNAAITRFRQEAQSVAALNHPNIIRVFDFDTSNGVSYMVMELIEGPSLSAVISDFPN